MTAAGQPFRDRFPGRGRRPGRRRKKGRIAINPQLEPVADGLYRLPIPLPYPTKPVNAYLARQDGGWAVVDTGAHNEETEQLWTEVLQGLDGPLAAIYATHYHPDHLGMAGWLGACSGAPIHMMARELEWARLMWADGMPQGERMADLCRLHGTPDDLAEGVRRGMVGQRRHTLPLPDAIVPVDEGDEIELGGRPYRALWTSGHSDYLYCLWDEGSGVLISGDHVLPVITPNVALWPGGRPDPLGRFIENLKRVRDLGPRRYLPGHGEPFAAEDDRVSAILDHHERRLARMLDAVAARGSGGATGFEVCDAVFRASQLGPHQLRFAMAETLAHLDLLERRGQLRPTGDRPVRYVR